MGRRYYSLRIMNIIIFNLDTYSLGKELFGTTVMGLELMRFPYKVFDRT